MTVSEAQKRASAKYQREKTKQVNVKFTPNDMELYEWLMSQEGSASGVIKALMRNAMENDR